MTKQTSLILRVCRADMTSRNGFKWPEVGQEVVAPDWHKKAECGNGLHGWLYGQGDHSCAEYWQAPDAKWLVLEADSDSIVMIGGKCKVPKAIVRFVGDVKSATDYLWEHEPRSRDVEVIGACRADKREGAQVRVGALGTATAGALGTATAGYSGTATAGYSGTATAGALGTATAGAIGTATAGYSGTATAGYSGTATAGLYGAISILYYDAKRDAYRRRVGEIDGETLKAGVAYRLDDNAQFVAVESSQGTEP
jgi:hypothetical protein